MISINILPKFVTFHLTNQSLDLWTPHKSMVNSINLIIDLLNLYENMSEI
jgi:hypothetical protein